MGGEVPGVIPDMAADIYFNRELLWQYVTNQELTASWYNKVMSAVLEVEMLLIQSQLTDIDAKLRGEQAKVEMISVEP